MKTTTVQLDTTVLEKLITVEAKLDALIATQAQIIARLENRDMGEVYKNLLKNVGEFIKDGLKDKPGH